MKKLLVILALCMVLSVVLVACETPETPENPTDNVTTQKPTEAPTTNEPTTNEPTTNEPTTGEPTTGEPTDEPTTDEPTTEESTTEEQPPEPVKVIAGKSWDSLTAVPGEVVFPDGAAFLEWEKNPVVDINMATNTLDVWGWVAFFTETEGTVGYKIDDNAVVYDASFTYTAEVGVQEHITKNVAGAKSACRMQFSIPVATLAAGEHTFALYAKDPAGNEELILEFKVTKTVPYVDTTDAAAGFNEWSFDGFYANNQLYFPEDGMANVKLEAQDKIVPVAYGTKYENIGFRGWVSFNQATEAFGYFISGVNTEIVYGEFAQARPDLETAGKVNGTGYNIVVPTADLSYGSYNVSIYAKLADGTQVKLYDITLVVLNLVVDTTSKLMCSIDHVNGYGPIKDDGTYEPHFAGIGGIATGKIDAAVAGKTNDANGILTLGGWCGISGGVNRYVWSVDGVNWFEVVSGGRDGEPLEGHYNSLNTEEGMTSTKNGMFTSGSFITIQLPKEYVGATGTIYVGAIPELNQGSVIVICELSNFTVGEMATEEPEPEIEPIVYDGTNGVVTVPAGQTVIFSIKNAGGLNMMIENVAGFYIGANNFVEGAPFDLSAGIAEGVLVQPVPADGTWNAYELILTNNGEADVEVNLYFVDPNAPVEGGEADGTPEAPFVMEGTEGSITAEILTGWDSVFYTYTATANGYLVFEGPANMCVNLEDATGFAWLFDGNGYYEVVEGTTYKFFIGDADYTAGTIEGTWAFVTELPAEEPVAPVEDIVLSVDTLGLASQSYAAGTANLGGVDFEYIQMGNYGDGLQMRDKNGNTSSIWNTTAFAAGIARIELVYSDSKDVQYSNADAVIFTFGNEAQGATYTTKLSTTAGEKTYTITPDAETYTFFKLEHDLGYTMYWKSITIVFADGTTASL